jgi:hypothetical protein
MKTKGLDSWEWEQTAAFAVWEQPDCGSRAEPAGRLLEAQMRIMSEYGWHELAVVRGHYQNVTSPEAARQWFAIFPDNPAPAQTAATPGRPLDESADGP